MDRELKQRKRRRTCADWIRLNAARRRRRDSAAKTVLQLLDLLSAALALLPESAVTVFPERNRGTMAERVGFEPTIPLQVCRISSAVHSTTLPPLRGQVGACSARAFS